MIPKRQSVTNSQQYNGMQIDGKGEEKDSLDEHRTPLHHTPEPIGRQFETSARQPYLAMFSRQVAVRSDFKTREF